MPESFVLSCECPPQGHGTVPPSLLPYVYSVNDLQGQITIAGTGAVDISSLGNTITIDVSAEAGLGSVTSVALASSSSNLTIVSGSPITTNGTITLNLAGNVGSIAGLTMAADQMLYSTGPGVFAATPLTVFGRSLIDDAAAVNARSTLGLVIGTNVQAYNVNLDSFLAIASFGGGAMALSGGLTVGTNLTVNANGSFGGTLSVTGASTLGTVSTGALTATTLAGNGSAITTLNASNLASGTVAVARGGTNIASYAVGDLLYAGAATTLTKLASVAAGSYLRSGGVTTAPVWSTLVLPNAATVGDIFSSSTTNTMGRITAVATGNALISGGVATLPSWGKITSSHVNNTIPTISGGVNADITAMGAVQFTGIVTLSADTYILGGLGDSNTLFGDSGDILTSTGVGTSWSRQISLDTLNINTSLSMEATITAGGVTGNQTINKFAGSVNIAAGGSSITVTNSLCTANTIVMCAIATNDTTAILKNVVASSGQFVIRTTANVTAETKITFVLVEPS